jgi:hypothetical protein
LLLCNIMECGLDVLYVLKFEIKRQKVPTLNEIPGSAPTHPVF